MCGYVGPPSFLQFVLLIIALGKEVEQGFFGGGDHFDEAQMITASVGSQMKNKPILCRLRRGKSTPVSAGAAFSNPLE